MAVPELKRADIGRGQVVSYRERGSGTPLVFLHGLGGRSESWVTQYDGFADRCRVIGWDAPGFGESTNLAKESPMIADYVDTLARFLDTLAIDRAHLVGHSVGTLMAAAFHKRYRDRVLSLTLAEAVTGSGTEPAEKRAEMIRAREKDVDMLGPAEFARTRTPNSLSPTAPAEVVARAVAFASQMKPEGYKKAFRAMVAGDMFAEAAPLKVPGMAVAGAHDKTAPPETVQRIAAAFPGMRVHQIDNIGHQIAMERPEQFNGLLARLLAEGASRAA